MSYETEQEKGVENLAVDEISVPQEVRKLVVDMIRRCPFRTADKIDWNHPAVTVKKEKDGWFFTCQVCHHTLCSGFIKDKPY